jgi:uncharacterized protein involved in exopolysaccharide biosynthesis
MGSGSELRHYVRAIGKRFWLVVIFVALAVGSVYYWMKSRPPQYQATVTVMVTAPAVNPPMSALPQQGATGAQMNRSPGAVYNDIINLITARPIAERVAQTLNIRPHEVSRAITATQIRGTDLIQVKATSGDREMAAKLANTATEQFIKFFREVNRRDMHDVRVYIEQQLALLRAKLEASDRLVQGFKERNRVVDLNQQRSQAATEAAQIQQDRDTTMLRIKEAEGKMAAARRRLSGENIERITFRATRDNPVFTQLQSRLTQLEIQRAQLAQVYTPQHPQRQQIEGELAQLKQQMQATARSVLSEQQTGLNPVHDQLISEIVTLEVDRSAANSRLEGLNFVQQRRMATISSLPALETGLNALSRENKILDTNYTLLSQRYQEALVRENEAGYLPAGVQILEPAVAPNAPAGARLPLFAGMAGLVGALLGIMAAIFIESADDRIRTPQDAERTLGAPVLVEVPNIAPPRTAPVGAALLIALFLTMVAGGSVVAARTVGDATATGGNAAVTMLVRLGRGIDGLASQVGQVIR